MVVRDSPRGTLVLRGQRIGPQAAAFLQHRFENFDQLETLDLYNNALGDGGVGSVMRMKVRRLNIGYNRLTNNGVLVLSQYLQLPTCQVEVLELGCNFNRSLFPAAKRAPSGASSNRNVVDEQGIQILAQAALDARSLRYLGLSGLYIGNEDGATAIGLLLQNSQTLAGLDISSTGIGDAAAGFIFKQLQENQVLEYLDVSDNELTFASAPLMSEALAQMPRLASLNYSDNPLGTQGAQALALGLSHNQSLERLGLHNCALDDEGCGLVVAALLGYRYESGAEVTDAFYDLLQNVEMRETWVQKLGQGRDFERYGSCTFENDEFQAGDDQTRPESARSTQSASSTSGVVGIAGQKPVVGRKLLASMSARGAPRPAGTDFVILSADGRVMRRQFFGARGSRPASASVVGVAGVRPGSGRRPYSGREVESSGCTEA